MTISNTSQWDQGQQWDETRHGLEKRGLNVTDKFLTSCPQLLRLNTTMVFQTADWIIQEFGVHYLQAEPRLLGYRPQHVQYGLEYMSIMMMMDAKSVCQTSPGLLLCGVDGGIQEQAVKVALGSAGTATSKASQTILGDAVSAMHALKKMTKYK